MRVPAILLALLPIATARDVLQGIPLHPAELVPNQEPPSVTPLDAQHDWVYPETLPPMPQCIAEQDQAAWLSAMTKCTKKQCMRHFGVICSRRQWRTQLSCLNTELSPQFLQQYIEYCSRSVLKKAQLYQWIRTATDRTWLVEVGDANGLQRLSPGSLPKGYATIAIIDRAPACLIESVSASSMEPFGQVMASCSFEAVTRHTGNAKRPWEYREGEHSMVALDTEVAGYDLTHAIIPDNDYFDKQCFCKTFDASRAEHDCAGPGVDSSRQRLWMHATCGSASLPPNWREGLKITPHDYIPTQRWTWPQCFDSIPDSVVRLQDQCTTNACSIGFNGYCHVQSAVERSCFCRNIGYDTCKGSCHVFESRIDYVRWLHDLCGAEEDWHGLPEDWHQLASVSRRDAIPWTWYKDSFSPSNNNNTGEANPSNPNQTCASSEWKHMSLLLINLAALFTAVFGPKPSSNSTTNPLTSILWFPRGIAVAALYLLANALNALLIQSTPSYSETPMVELALLWCTMPRLTWLTMLLVLASPYKRSTFSAIATAIVSETILQALSSPTVLSTVSYGFTHGFYTPNTPLLRNLPGATYMYAGALMWTIAMLLSIPSLLCILFDPTKLHHSTVRSSDTRNAHLAAQLKEPFVARWTWIEQKVAEFWIDRDWDLDFERTPLVQSEGHVHAVYGTLPTKTCRGRTTKTRVVRATLVAGLSMFLLWISQWVFWIGFIRLAGEEEFCTPQLELSTLTWVVSSMAAVIGVVKA